MAVLVPMISFLDATVQFAGEYSEAERIHAAKAMLQKVIAAANGFRVVVVAPEDAEDVRLCALVNGAKFLSEPAGGGLNAAVRAGVDELTNLEYERVAVVHGKLPNVEDLSWLAADNDIVIVPDHTGNDTNAIALPTDIAFTFSYGNDSFQKHCIEARRHGFEPRIVIDAGVAFDASSSDDLPQVTNTLATA